jgi:hypothetical protein
MRRTLAFILCGLCPVGCVSHTHTSQPVNDHPSKPALTDSPAALAPWEWDGLERAVDVMDVAGGSLPEQWLRRLQPVEVYRDQGNVVIALFRDAHYERGYYFVSSYSSSGGFLILNGSTTYDRGWTFTPLGTATKTPTTGSFLFHSSFDSLLDNSSDAFPSLIYAYSRQR